MAPGALVVIARAMVIALDHAKPVNRAASLWEMVCQCSDLGQRLTSPSFEKSFPELQWKNMVT